MEENNLRQRPSKEDNSVFNVLPVKTPPKPPKGMTFDQKVDVDVHQGRYWFVIGLLQVQIINLNTDFT